MASLLPLPDDPRLQSLIADWPEPFTTDAIVSGHYYPTSYWLGLFERVLAERFPSASSRDRKLTARHYYPGYLRDGHDVP